VIIVPRENIFHTAVWTTMAMTVSNGKPNQWWWTAINIRINNPPVSSTHPIQLWYIPFICDDISSHITQRNGVFFLKYQSKKFAAIFGRRRFITLFHDTSVLISTQRQTNPAQDLTCCSLQTYTGRFIMFYVLTDICNKKIKRPTLMELLTATGKLKTFFFDN
jgi:hypothetical protein